MDFEKFSTALAKDLDPDSLIARLLVAELEGEIREELNVLVARRFDEIRSELKLGGGGSRGLDLELRCAIDVSTVPKQAEPCTGASEPVQMSLLDTFSARREGHLATLSTEERMRIRTSVTDALRIR